jgi:quercetin dioxygenase-like cupin family protein
MKPSFPYNAVWMLLAVTPAAETQTIRVIRFSESKAFQMGTVTSRRIVHPDMGAKKTTLNHSVSKPGNEFAQHVHDYSDDTILVLAGEVDLRQGDSKRRFSTGECAFVPMGQIHGTITAGTSEATMVSFQTPPDLVLYSGARDSSRPGAAAPKGVITPGAVKYLNYSSKNGLVTSQAMGARNGVFAHRRLKPAERFRAKVDAGGEMVLFVWKGAIEVKHKSGTYSAGETDTVFVSGEAKMEVNDSSGQGSIVIQIHAPPAKGM